MTQIEPVIPIVLGLHGLALYLVGSAPGWAAAAFLTVAGLGVGGLGGWTSSTARIMRAAAVTGTALGLSIADPSLVPALLQWYYAVAAVYALVLGGPAAALIGPVTGLCYVIQVAAGAAPVPYPIAWLRAGVLAALGLVTWTAGLSYRAAASHDGLTGLANRTLLHQRLEEALSSGTPTALLLLDLDQFKEVNDTLGHRYGDLLLQQVGARLLTSARTGDTVARLGGDEFAIVMPDTDATQARALADRLRRSLVEAFVVEEALLAIDASVGIAIAPEHATDGERLLQRADVAMYDAKASGTGSAVYDPAVARLTADRLALLAELRVAISGNQLLVEYQPKIDLLSGRPVGLEALVRWVHPVRGRIAPDEFIPLAERSGFIHPLTAFVLDTALHECSRWQAAGLDLQVSVNLSARNLQEDDLPERVDQALRQHGLAADRLELEITESFLVHDPQRARSLLIELSNLGVQLAIDDFGTGLSSLTYLRNLPVDVLKIDKSFVTRMADSPIDSNIVRGVIDLAASLGLRTVAEGVEDQPTLVRLRQIGCTLAQGYHTGRPMAADAVIAWCATHASAR